ncbi:MAG: GNAT family N-acetyltransferase [Halocynthiibacter sp.]
MGRGLILYFPRRNLSTDSYEAALAMRRWAFDVRKLDTLVSYVDPENLRSRKLAERLGAKLDDAAIRQDPTDLVFRHPQVRE